MSVSITETNTEHLHPTEDQEEEEEERRNGYLQYRNYTRSSEIEEEEEEEEEEGLFEIKHGEAAAMESIKEDQLEGSLFSFDVQSRSSSRDQDCVYVGVGKSESSLDALSWTLNNLIHDQSTMVYLIHVFPQIHHIPSPLGKLPKNQVSPEQVEIYMAQERGKRRELLQKFLNLCSASKVKVDTILIESDMVGKAISDLIPILNIKKLVLGTTKSSLRKLRAKRGNGMVDQILQNASYFCDIKIICDGKEVTEQMIGSPSSSPNEIDGNAKSMKLQHQPTNNNNNNNNDSFSCMCFKSPKVM